MAEKMAVSVICPVCKNSYEGSSPVAKCPVCGHAENLDALIEKTKKASSENNVAVYRMMASADAYFAKKSYDEAYIGYSSVLEADRNYLKAYFRRELTSQYLMLDSSSVYLSSESFFMKMGEIKDRFRQLDPEDKETKKLRILMCKDMLEYISVRSDYEKRYASAHKNVKTVEVYMSNLILLFEYTVEAMRILEGLTENDNSKELAYLIIECCSLAMKIRGMLTAGAEYIETSDKMEDFSGENSAKNVSRVKRRMLTQNEELDIETKAGYVQKVKNNIVSNAQGELYKELRAAKEQSEQKVDKDIETEDKKRAEYEQWRRNNEQEYMAADKVILISDIAGKASVIFAIIMFAVYFIEMLAFEKKLTVMLVFGLIFVAVRIGLGFLRKSAEKKKSFYSKVIEGDSVNLRYGGADFKEL
ncbi:MAG: hypothetical protein IJZ61_05895 [Oscillospiraceae bacterium]|nr:hypothetical protein [Oscillospiraceae bacterium]